MHCLPVSVTQFKLLISHYLTALKGDSTLVSLLLKIANWKN